MYACMQMHVHTQFHVHVHTHTHTHTQDVSVLHKHFIGECFHRLDDLMDVTGVSGPPKTSTGRIGDPELRSQAIERLLLLAQRYIIAVEVCDLSLSLSLSLSLFENMLLVCWCFAPI